eukprot:9515746-Alexandrium_andersonii.AAC.1
MLGLRSALAPQRSASQSRSRSRNPHPSEVVRTEVHVQRERRADVAQELAISAGARSSTRSPPFGIRGGGNLGRS